jgi:hypothetical protein
VKHFLAGLALAALMERACQGQYLRAYFSDRGRSDQADGGRHFSVIMDALGERE